MSFFSGYWFFVYLAALLIPAAVLGLLEKPLRPYRLALTVFFIYMVYRDTPEQMKYLLLYAAGAAYLVKIYAFLRRRYGRNPWLYGHAVALALAPLVVSKWSAAHGGTVFGFLGISYICFRVIQVVIEIYDGVLEDVPVTRFLEFLLFFPSLSSGPIDRSRRFAEDDLRLWTRDEYLNLLNEGVYKLVLGAFYKIVCSALFYKLLNDVFAERYTPLYLVGYAYVYGLYMFFDFAGYSSLAVGTAYILGIRLPDNFNKPFLSVDIKDFWNRWHITLSTWFRDFVFTRFVLNSIRNKRFKTRLGGAAAGLMVNMLVMGLWHGPYAHYIAYGLYHGILLAVTEVYQKKSAFYRAHKERLWYKTASWFLTLNAVMLGFLIFSGHIRDVWQAALYYL